MKNCIRCKGRKSEGGQSSHDEQARHYVRNGYVYNNIGVKFLNAIKGLRLVPPPRGELDGSRYMVAWSPAWWAQALAPSWAFRGASGVQVGVLLVVLDSFQTLL